MWRQKLKAIRPFTSLKVGKRATPSQKRTISRYYEAARLYGLVGDKVRPGLFIYRTRSKRYLDLAKRQSGIPESGFPLFKVAVFENVPDGAEIKARRRDGKVFFDLESKYRREVVFLFVDYEKYPGEFAENPEAVVKRIWRKCKGADFVRFITGEWLSKSTADVGQLMNQAKRYINSYGRDSRVEENTFDKWWRGIVAIYFKNQKDKRTYLYDMQFKEERKRQRDEAFRNLMKGI